jgi:hypothetical protein
MAALYEIVAQYRSLETLDASEDLPIEVIRDTLEGLTGELTVKATNVAKFILNVEAMAEAVDGAAKQMKLRAERMRKRADSIREYLRTNMQGAGITKIEAVEFVLQLKKNPPAVVIDNEAEIPVAFKPTPAPPPPPGPTIDKKAIAIALKAHASIVAAAATTGAKPPPSPVPGAHLEQAERLEIKA